MDRIYTDDELCTLREGVKEYLSEERYRHTLGVERAAMRLGEMYLPEKVSKLRAAALLHDITKAYNLEKQLKCSKKFGIIIDKYDAQSVNILHGMTASVLISELFPGFSDSEIISAVRYHTTGRDKMTMFEAIVYLADYIDDTRTYEGCVRLREKIFSKGADEKLFCSVIAESLDMTICHLIKKGVYINTDTVKARNYFISRISELSEKVSQN